MSHTVLKEMINRVGKTAEQRYIIIADVGGVRRTFHSNFDYSLLDSRTQAAAACRALLVAADV